ncbi:MAG: hypothetical protein ABI142_03790, partial [Bryocella sp.]
MRSLRPAASSVFNISDNAVESQSLWEFCGRLRKLSTATDRMGRITTEAVDVGGFERFAATRLECIWNIPKDKTPTMQIAKAIPADHRQTVVVKGGKDAKPG